MIHNKINCSHFKSNKILGLGAQQLDNLRGTAYTEINLNTNP